MGCLAVFVASRDEVWVSNASDGHCYVYSAVDNRCKERFVLASNYELIRTASTSPVKAMSISVDDVHVFTGGSELCSFNVAKRLLLHSAPCNTSAIVSLHVLNDRGVLVSGHAESEVSIWCSIALTQLACIQLGGGRITAVLPIWQPSQHSTLPVTQDDIAPGTYIMRTEMSPDDGFYTLWIADSEGRLAVWNSLSAPSTASGWQLDAVVQLEEANLVESGPSKVSVLRPWVKAAVSDPPPPHRLLLSKQPSLDEMVTTNLQ